MDEPSLETMDEALSTVEEMDRKATGGPWVPDIDDEGDGVGYWTGKFYTADRQPPTPAQRAESRRKDLAMSMWQESQEMGDDEQP